MVADFEFLTDESELGRDASRTPANPDQTVFTWPTSLHIQALFSPVVTPVHEGRVLREARAKC